MKMTGCYLASLSGYRVMMIEIRARVIHSERGRPRDHSSHTMWDKAFLKIRRPGSRPRTLNGSLSAPSLVSRPGSAWPRSRPPQLVCPRVSWSLVRPHVCLCAANQSKSNFPSVNNVVIVIKLLTLVKILGFGTGTLLMSYRYSFPLMIKKPLQIIRSIRIHFGFSKFQNMITLHKTIIHDTWTRWRFSCKKCRGCFFWPTYNITIQSPVSIRRRPSL